MIDDNIKRILILDDEANRRFDAEAITEAFAKNGITVDLKLCRDICDAISTINELYSDGQKFDIISVDNYAYPFKLGMKYISEIINITKEQSIDLPEKIYLHSVSSELEENVNGVDIECIEVNEWKDVGYFAANEGYIQSGKAVLRKYLNTNWGCDFPLSQYEAECRVNNLSIEINDIPKYLGYNVFDFYDGKTEVMPMFEPELPLDKIFSSINTSDLSLFIQEPILDINNIDWKTAKTVEFELQAGGDVSGVVALNESDVTILKQQSPNKPIIFVSGQATPDIIPLMDGVSGLIIIKNDELAQHIRIIAENHNLPILIGAKDQYHFTNGEEVSMRCEKGYLINCAADVIKPENSLMLKVVAKAANQFRHECNGVQIMANADTPQQINAALKNGADGIGLVRSEYAFYDPTYLSWLTRHLNNPNGASIDELIELQLKYFTDILSSISSEHTEKPITFRLFDPVLEQFLSPELAQRVKMDIGNENTRGVQLATQYPDIYKGQLSAFFAAVANTEYAGTLKIEVPNTKTADELVFVRNMADAAANGRYYKFGSMIETVASATDNAAEIAKYCDFANYGMNDLTSAFMGGVRRNDVAAIENWANMYRHTGKSPFLCLPDTVKMEIKTSARVMREANPNIEIGICGEQLSDRLSMEFALSQKLNISVPYKYLDYAKVVEARFYALE